MRSAENNGDYGRMALPKFSLFHLLFKGYGGRLTGRVGCMRPSLGLHRPWIESSRYLCQLGRER
jgi:hypothetical protein